MIPPDHPDIEPLTEEEVEKWPKEVIVAFTEKFEDDRGEIVPLPEMRYI